MKVLRGRQVLLRLLHESRQMSEKDIQIKRVTIIHHIQVAQKLSLRGKPKDG